jgi:hypothetical protein
MARSFHEISPFRNYPFSASGTRLLLRAILRSKDEAIIMTQNGAIGCRASLIPFCDARIGEEIFWYVDTDASPREGIALLRAFDDWMKNQKVDTVTIKTIENERVDMEAVSELLSRRKYVFIEKTHMKVM